MSSDKYYRMLTKGAIGHILEGTPIEEPVFQMLAYKNMPTDSNRRYRLSLSDGVYIYQCCIIVGDLSDNIENNTFDRFCLLKIKRHMLNEISGKQVIVLADLHVLVKGTEVGVKLGNPEQYGSPNAPPLSNFPPNKHLTETDMEVEFENDPFADIDNASSSNLLNGNQASKKSKNTLNAACAIPISNVNPYSNKWIIKGRVTAKTAKRSWSNAKGEGTLFSFDIKDSSGDIRLTAFKTECDKYYDFIKVGDVYLVNKGVVKAANKQYTRTTSEYEITLNQDSVVEACSDQSDCPTITYEFEPFETLKSKFGGYADIIGVLRSVNDAVTLTKKGTQKELIKRDIDLVDQTKNEIVLTIWGETASNFSAELGDVIVVRGVRVSDYNGLSLTTTSNSVLEINPDIDEVHELKGWYTRVRDNIETTKLTNNKGNTTATAWNNLSEISVEKLQQEESNIIYLQTKAVIHQVGKSNMYKACEKCKKKMIDMNNGTYRCEKCNEDYDRFVWRIILSFSIADHTKNMYIQAFQDEAQILLGDQFNIQDLGNLFETNQTEFEDAIRTINFKTYIFKVKAKMEHFNDENRIRAQAMGILPINYQEYGAYLIEKIGSN